MGQISSDFSGAEDSVQQQVDGYNAHDIDAFMAPYSPDVVITGFPGGNVMARGIDEMRPIYQRLFANNPDVRCRVVKRMVQGNIVVDQEEVTGYADGQIVRAIAIYEVHEGLIRRLWIATQ